MVFRASQLCLKIWLYPERELFLGSGGQSVLKGLRREYRPVGVLYSTALGITVIIIQLSV